MECFENDSKSCISGIKKDKKEYISKGTRKGNIQPLDSNLDLYFASTTTTM